MINILGICGSPVKDSNTELILKDSLKAVEQDGVQIEVRPHLKEPAFQVFQVQENLTLRINIRF